MNSTLKTFGAICLTLSALAGSGAAQAVSCGAGGAAASVAGTPATPGFNHDGIVADACFTAAVNSSSVPSGSVGFLARASATDFATGGAPGTDRSALARLDANGASASGSLFSNASRFANVIAGVPGANALGLDRLRTASNAPSDSTVGPFDSNVHAPPVPEPESCALMLVGLLVVGAIVRRNRAV